MRIVADLRPVSRSLRAAGIPSDGATDVRQTGGKRRLVGRLAFETPAGAVLGDTRIRLLEAIVAQAR